MDKEQGMRGWFLRYNGYHKRFQGKLHRKKVDIDVGVAYYCEVKIGSIAVK